MDGRRILSPSAEETDDARQILLITFVLLALSIVPHMISQATNSDGRPDIDPTYRKVGISSRMSGRTADGARAMKLFQTKESRRATLLERYSDRAGRLIEQQMTEAALIAAKQDAEQSATRAREAMMRAQAANRTKSEILANVSHELRTPLNAIIGFSELIYSQLFGPGGTEKYIEYACDIHDSGKHLLGVINDILDFAKIDAGELKLYEEATDLSAVIASCRNMLATRAHKAGLALETPARESPILIWADERKLKQILLNLLSNAVKFTPAGGRVSVTIDSTEEALSLIVSDTGIGIAPEHIERALAPFQQVDSDLNRRYDGAGLGLTITKSLVEMHGGQFAIQSIVGIGTSVTVALPSWRVARAEQSLSKIAAEEPGQTGRANERGNEWTGPRS